MQGQDWESEQQQDCVTAWHEELSAAASGMTWASWKASPKIRAIASLMFLTRLRVIQSAVCSNLFSAQLQIAVFTMANTTRAATLDSLFSPHDWGFISFLILVGAILRRLAFDSTPETARQSSTDRSDLLREVVHDFHPPRCGRLGKPGCGRRW